MKKKILVVVILFLGVHFSSCSKEEFLKRKPNILIILADDLGYADVGYNGSDIRTPNIDRIAFEGVRLEQYYSCPVCSPSRAGLMTGRYPIRYGLMRSAISPQAEFGLSSDEETIAEMLSRAGYNFRGMVGKWHLGYRRQEWHPYNRGFTYFKGSLNGAVNYFNRNLSIGPQQEGSLDWYVNDQLSHEEGYTTDIIGDAAVEFINSVPADKPFFLYVPFTAPHGPFQAKSEDIEKYSNRTGTKKIYAGMVDNMDQNIGKILECLAERGQMDNTFILFASDNGGLLKGASNGELRGGKLTPYQGGIRVVAAVRWPSGGISGGQIVDKRVGYIDIFPTLMEVADFKGSPRNDLDGKNILPILKGATIEDREWYSYLDQGDDKIEDLVVNKNQWKLIVKRPAPDRIEEKSVIYQLFKIASDPYEKNDVSDQYPDKVDELSKGTDEFYGLKASRQVPRYNENSNGGVIPPPDWQSK
ncbi:sulfatase-like hydrolase/transferase [Sunxiuqinia sp. A32]|uniref:sulfatase-like hydrolase/transferase n=1 Tax=Sunxiuqinia sp. A32 TaxID=3461496 RepID=UPI00404634CA